MNPKSVTRRLREANVPLYSVRKLLRENENLASLFSYLEIILLLGAAVAALGLVALGAPMGSVALISFGTLGFTRLFNYDFPSDIRRRRIEESSAQLDELGESYYTWADKHGSTPDNRELEEAFLDKFQEAASLRRSNDWDFCIAVNGARYALNKLTIPHFA